MFRCPDCRTRRKDWGLFTAHVRDSGHRLCKCGGYHYAHRPGSTYCERHPLCDLHRASRSGADDETLAEIRAELVLEAAWEGSGQAGGACPF